MVKMNSNLHTAKAVKNDEFYTQLSDIENELRHYKDHFKGKTVYCNCDDPKVSNFFKYFSLNFEYLGLKKLIASCYRNIDAGKQTDGLSDKAVWLEYTGEQGDETIPTDMNILVHEFEGDGDFRSEESIELLKQADIVVTNPPFSLFREYVAQLMEYEKDFLILGNLNAVTYKEVFPLLKNNDMWMGVSRVGTGQMWFIVSDEAPIKTGQKVDENGTRYQTVGSSAWFTNLDNQRIHEPLVLWKTYATEPELYPEYDNYNAINVDKVVDIPIDYDGAMGVPITFLGKYNPDQFEILGCSYVYGEPIGYHIDGAGYGVSVGGVNVYKRIFIKHKK